MKRSVVILAAVACGFAFPLAAETYTAASYVQNGLVGQWDGLENAGLGLPHDPTTNYWVDLTGQSGDFAVFTSVASFTDNGLKKDAQGVMATNVTASTRSDVRTIEVVVSGAPASGWVHAFFITQNQTVSLNNSSGHQSGYREYFFDYNKFGWCTLQKPEQETIAVKYSSSTAASSFYSNGATPDGSKQTNNWGSDGVATTMHIGGRTGSKFTGSGDVKTYGYTIHAVRLYDRELAESEIRWNATVDQIRFFGAPGEILPSGSKFAVVATAGTGGMVAADDVNAAPNAIAKNEVPVSGPYPVSLRAIPLQGWKFSGWTGDFSCVTVGSTSTPVIVVSPYCGRAYHATFERDSENPEIPYITDGLVGRWDGIENAGAGIHDASTNRWVDLSGQGGDFIVRSETASFGETGLKKDAAGVCATNLLVHTNVLTIEGVVSEMPSSGWVNAVFLGKNQTLTLRNETNNKRRFFFDYANLNRIMTGQPDVQTMSVIYANVGGTPKGQSFYLDGMPPQNGEDAGSGMYWSGEAQTNTWIGGRMSYSTGTDYTTFGYTVNALRFYNRALTVAEIAYNSAVDTLRFRGLRKEGFAYRLVDGNVKCQLRAWMNGLGGTVKLNDGAAVTNSVATALEAFGTAQSATFTATPAEGWKFLGWAGDTDAIVSGTANDLTVNVSATRGVSLQAVFTQTSRYVQDGLIGFWDARENAGLGRFDADAIAWKDLAGISGDFHLNAASGVFETNALHKIGRGRLALNATRRTDVRTIEAVVSSLPKDVWSLPIFVSADQHITIKDQGAGKDRLFFFDYSKYGWKTTERPEQMTVTLLCESETKGEKVYVNATEPLGSAYNNWWSDTSTAVMTMGGRLPDSGGDTLATGYRVHAIRFYNRQLTPGEIKRNARHDGYRYFGVPEPGMRVILR